MAATSGYVLKQVRGGNLVEAIHHVASGGSMIDPSLTATLLERIRRGPATAPEMARLGLKRRTQAAVLASKLLDTSH